MSLELLTGEQRLELFSKMDAVSVTGVWLAQYPVAAVGHGHTVAAGRHYWMLLEEERRRSGRSPEVQTPKAVRDQLLDEVIRRITEQDADDLAIFLGA